MAAIEVEGLRKSYAGREVLRDVAFAVDPGEVFALLGPNGAGKTTTVEILEGYRRADGGSVRVLGVDPARAGRAFRARLGIVLQSAGVYPYLTVREVVELYARYYPRPREPAAVLAAVGLEEAADRRVRTLSGGQARRLDMALALVGRPELIFLDEPTTGFDPSARRDAWQVVRRLAEGGTTVLLTSHYMDEVQALADRAAVLRDGAIVALDAPAALARGDARAEIRFLAPAGVAPEALARATGGELRLDGGRIAIAGDETTLALHALTGLALEQGFALDELEVVRRTLEDAYLELTTTRPAEREAG
jgi:ABC-2 type transport system ATP-binding protein